MESEKGISQDGQSHDAQLCPPPPLYSPRCSSLAPPPPASYIRAKSNKFTPNKLRCSTRNGIPFFLIGPNMLPNVLKDTVDSSPSFDIARNMTPATLLDHTLYSIRSSEDAQDCLFLIPLQSAASSSSAAEATATETANLTTTSALNTVTGLAIFNLTEPQRNMLRDRQAAPFRHSAPVRIRIRLSDGTHRTIDAAAFVETTPPSPSATAILSRSSYRSSPTSSAETFLSPENNWLLRPEMQKHRCSSWDVARFAASTLYQTMADKFEKWEAENGACHWDGDDDGDGLGNGYDAEEEGAELVDRNASEGGEPELVDNVDHDELEAQGGKEGEGSGWPARPPEEATIYNRIMRMCREYFGDL
ncbi:hypothetical protein AJ79_03416 [Helicocarpus griseus UAMH5409]|uniref:Uncharacterized protein n=1 Tax=Helicocarpus griseus UAMH5409 TaxID=1447875 RepID=A0A2B7XZ52_9EURO|nr:hypothetical protein AJ79_03416 [Helicocarpus griseus UAMH5409]